MLVQPGKAKDERGLFIGEDMKLYGFGVSGKMRRMGAVTCVIGDRESSQPSKALTRIGLASLNMGIDSEEAIDWEMKLSPAPEFRRRETDTDMLVSCS